MKNWALVSMRYSITLSPSIKNRIMLIFIHHNSGDFFFKSLRDDDQNVRTIWLFKVKSLYSW